MAWNLQGSYVETCSCDLMCPCNMSFDHGATYDFCRVTLVFIIKEGEIEGTDVGGLTVAAVVDTPQVGGQKGGPMEAITPLIGEMLGVERAPIEVVEEGLSHSVKIGDAVDFEIEDIVPFGVETGQPVRLVGVFHPASSEFNAS